MDIFLYNNNTNTNSNHFLAADRTLFRICQPLIHALGVVFVFTG
jgi:hypothetical protein